MDKDRIIRLFRMLEYHSDTFASLPVTNLRDVGEIAVQLFSSVLRYRIVVIFSSIQSEHLEVLSCRGIDPAVDPPRSELRPFWQYIRTSVDEPLMMKTDELDDAAGRAARLLGLTETFLAAPIKVYGEKEKRDIPSCYVLLSEPEEEYVVRADLPALGIVSGFIAGAINNCLTIEKVLEVNRALEEEISKRRQTEEKIRRERQQLLSIFESISEPIYIADPQTYEILYANSTLMESFGQDIIGGRCYRVLQGHDRPCSFCTNDIIMKGKGEPYQWEYHNLKVNKDYIIVDRIIKWPDGRDVRFTFHIDISEKKRAERELIRVKERLQYLLGSSPAVIYSAKAGGDFETTFISENVSQQLGYSPRDFEENPRFWFENLHPDDAPAVLAVLPRDSHVHEYRFRHKDGSYRWIHDEYKLVRDPAGEPEEIIGYWLDVTERRMALEEKKKLESQLRQSQKMEAIGTLAGGIAHDFNNILGGILGNAQLANLFCPEESKVKPYLENVIQATNRAAKLVKQILTFSRQSEQEKKILQLGPLIKESLKFFRASLATNIELDLSLTAGEVTIQADPTQIHQILLNLCSNAAHAMQERGGRLSISLSEVDIDARTAKQYVDIRPGPHVELVVSDTGTGIDPAIMEQIFDPYFTTKGPEMGSGIGLAVVHGIVKSHGGVISVESRPGQGTAFRILLPRVMAGREEPTRHHEALKPGKERILLVEDEEIINQAMKEILEHLGYRVEAMTSPLAALAAFREAGGDYDLVITDQTMPYLTGAELIRELLAIKPEIPIILCTGYSASITEEKAKEIGAREFLTKPLDTFSLARTVRKLLDDRSG